MNSGLVQNLLAALTGVAIAFLLVVKPWLGIIAIVGAGVIYYRTMQASLHLHHSLMQSRARDIDRHGLQGDLSSQEVKPATAYLNRGRSLLARQDYVGAIGDFDRVIWVESDCRVAYYHRAVCLLAVKDFEQAAIDLAMAQNLARQYQDRELLSEIDRTLTEIPNSA